MSGGIDDGYSEGITGHNGCFFCVNPMDGENCFPYYALAPHYHDENKTGGMIGSTVFIDGPMPINYMPDPDGFDAHLGIYLFCPKCGASD